MSAVAAIGLLLVNVAAFALFGIDKVRARNRRRRISERTLLLLALIGGTAGAFAGRHAFRHKTRKQPFSTLLWMIVAAHATSVAAWAML